VLSPYMHIMVLALLWVEHPKSAHILGLGGGRMPTYLHRHLPDLAIECTEIDPDVYDLAKKFFGFKADEKLRVFVKDGREFLATRTSPDPYDMILLDGFVGVGFSPLRLATQEFMLECKAQLEPHGVLVVNLLPAGGLVAERIKTIQSVFANVYIYIGEGALVIFATNGERVTISDLIGRAFTVQKLSEFDFSFVSLAQSIIPSSENDDIPQQLREAAVLTDSTPPNSIPIPENLLRGVGRNDPCPCGSGRKFKKCHGRE